MRNILVGFICAVAASALISCSEPTGVGADVFPPSDIVNAQITDTLTIQTSVEREDSVYTSGKSRQLIGTMDDPVFGKSFAGTFSQVTLPTNNLNLGDNLALDSVVLTLRYATIPYGDPSATHTFNVYELTESIDNSKRYTATANFAHQGTPIGQVTNFVAAPADSVDVGGLNQAPHLRIRLDNAFGQNLLNQSGGANFASNDAFKQFLKGFFIAPDTSSGYSNAMLMFNWADPLTRLSLYYSNSNSDSLVEHFGMNVNAAVVNHFKHQYDGYPAGQALYDGGAEDSIAYLQGINGLRVRVKIPSLENFGPITILKAELVLTQLNDPNSTLYPVPQNILPRIINAQTGEIEATLDELFSSVTNFYDINGAAVQENGRTVYRINLARYLNLWALNQLEEKEFVLSVVPNAESAARVAVGGGNHPNENLRMKLNLYYTKL